MKKLFALLILALAYAHVGHAQSVSKDAILGEWLAESKDGKVLIYKQGEKYFGKVSSGKDGSKKDTHNPDAKLREQNIVGSVILKGFDFTGKSWENGTIYDPNNGKTYSCTMKIKSANELEIRGFIGISLLGRTTVWTKVK
ncbi:DUF2147 domain-containing protein [Arcicella sp. LKC2W]|uniref:DUF2147 domain-containing protein n=1 Tax=Arcicella sp. LKC2W TaxID=2984198 RepID=UPI002B202B26|nr:DUF2147 domain-containing protein [Arcicella sp. LKC2W]MEA5458067.1 DUF2147 domain-containing protein [Arcicella sp. LKC2W]